MDISEITANLDSKLEYEAQPRGRGDGDHAIPTGSSEFDALILWLPAAATITAFSELMMSMTSWLVRSHPGLDKDRLKTLTGYGFARTPGILPPLQPRLQPQRWKWVLRRGQPHESDHLGTVGHAGDSNPIVGHGCQHTGNTCFRASSRYLRGVFAPGAAKSPGSALLSCPTSISE